MVSKSNNDLLRDYKKLLNKINSLRNYHEQSIQSNVINFFIFISTNQNIKPYFKDYLETYKAHYILNIEVDSESFNTPVSDEDKIKFALGLLKQFSDQPIVQNEDVIIKMVMHTGEKKIGEAYEKCFDEFIEKPLNELTEDIEYDLREKEEIPMNTTFNFNGDVSQSQFGANSVQNNTLNDNSIIQQIEKLEIDVSEDNRQIINEIQSELKNSNIDKDSIRGKCLKLLQTGGAKLLNAVLLTIADPTLKEIGENVLNTFYN
ncbi:hypothetical protein [Staphylococcus epidermidis]|uniref:hypothetical protein n=2 Tax=Staphylococcus epidermidis TaxID=1282 RepID=UPI001E486B46|nr:hypothetical protein [Staphylococcus epidermidis]MCD8922066.1 hypothetical protein [Staphylococcus epidermidis]MCD9056192.1 hypothetical protein [Staphylococcus epidermidis]MEB5737075.1 hypothetical protein [Staphylococcus epidermidis]MEB7387125.1 hypothetical protein [Staphylococcus epidermidis]